MQTVAIQLPLISYVSPSVAAVFRPLFHYRFHVFIFFFVQFYLTVDYSAIFTVFDLAHFLTEHILTEQVLHGKAYKNRSLAWRSMLSKRFTIIRPLTAQIIACPVFTTRYLYNIPGHCFSILILYLWQSFSKSVHSKTWHQLCHGLMLKGSLLYFTKLRLLWLINYASLKL